MTQDQRKRRSFQYPAQIDRCDGSAMLPCLIWDITDRGAQISIETAGYVPDRFTLHLASGRGPQRHCRVATRNHLDVTVEFVTAPPPGSRLPAGEAADNPAAGAKLPPAETFPVD